MAALGFVSVQGLAHGLPGGGPEISALAIAQIEITSRLVQRHGVKAQPRKSSLRRRLIKAITPGIVSNDGAVLGASQIITPRAGSIGAGNDILSASVVKISELHTLVFLF